MPNRNLCASIPVELHEKFCEEREKAGMTNAEYMITLLTEYYDWKEKGGSTMAQENGKTRTLAFQISEELFQRIKAHLERETARTGQKLTQKEFVVGLIEAALAEAEQADGETADNCRTADVEPAEGETDATESGNDDNSQPADAEPAEGEPDATEVEDGEDTDNSHPADAESATDEPDPTESGNDEDTEDAEDNAE